MKHSVGITLPPLAASCRFVYVLGGVAHGLTTDAALADSAREHGYMMDAYKRTSDGPTEWDIRLATREPEQVDDDA